jgi:molybdopterin converting factor small subunit
VKVRIPTPLRSYTGNRPEVDVDVDGGGATVDDVLVALDRQCPGIRFRVVDEQGRLRQHMNVFLAGERCRDLTRSVAGLDELVIMQALSGG